MTKRFLNIILLDDLHFGEMLSKLEKAFDLPFPYENIKGRCIATTETKNYNILVVDRIDELGDFLSNDYHTLKVVAENDENFNYENIENDIKEKLKKGNVKWERGIWSKLQSEKKNREFFK